MRADLKELHDLDLEGAPYGYTPFCDSRTDMDGYRSVAFCFMDQRISVLQVSDFLNYIHLAEYHFINMCITIYIW